MNLGELVLCLGEDNPVRSFPIEGLCNALDASAGTYWARGEHIKDEMILSGEYNRPDLRQKEFKLSFLYKNSFISDLSITRDSPVRRGSVASFTRKAWENAEIQAYTITNFAEMQVIAFFSKQGILHGLLHLYYRHSSQANVSDLDLCTFAQIAGSFISELTDEAQRSELERRKIGHEISRLLSDCNNRINNIIDRPPTGSFLSQELLTKMSDVRQSILSAIEANRNETFRNGVEKRMRRSTYVEFREQLLSSAHQALSAYKGKNLNEAYAPEDILEIRISDTDLDLMLSNIFSNAAKYSTVGSTITWSMNRRGSDAVVQVTNVSASIPTEEIEKLWRLGYRGSNAGDELGGGLGLAIVNDICDVYGIKRDLRQRTHGLATWTDFRLEFPSKRCRWIRKVKF